MKKSPVCGGGVVVDWALCLVVERADLTESRAWAVPSQRTMMRMGGRGMRGWSGGGGSEVVAVGIEGEAPLVAVTILDGGDGGQQQRWTRRVECMLCRACSPQQGASLERPACYMVVAVRVAVNDKATRSEQQPSFTGFESIHASPGRVQASIYVFPQSKTLGTSSPTASTRIKKIRDGTMPPR